MVPLFKIHSGNKQHWWAVGLFGPLLGGVLGAFIYSFVIGPQVNIEHLEGASIPRQEQEAMRIRHVHAANCDAAENWRKSISATTMVPISRPTPNVSPYPSYSTNNNNIM